MQSRDGKWMSKWSIELHWSSICPVHQAPIWPTDKHSSRKSTVLIIDLLLFFFFPSVCLGTQLRRAGCAHPVPLMQRHARLHAVPPPSPRRPFRLLGAVPINAFLIWVAAPANGCKWASLRCQFSQLGNVGLNCLCQRIITCCFLRRWR